MPLRLSYAAHRLRRSARAAISSRRRWVTIVVLAQAGVMFVGWLFATKYTRAAIEITREGDGTRGEQSLWSPGSPIVALALALVVLACTGLITARLMRRHDRDMEEINAGLELEVRRRVNQSLGFRNAMITGLAKLADFRDSDTGAHLDRIAEYSALLAGALRGVFPEIDDDWISRLRIGSTMHDIGKVGVADAILLKPGQLTPEERSAIEQHPIIGSDTLAAVRDRMGEDPLVEMSLRIALYHHERWDGSGYPLKIGGDQIPLEARIVALADVYDALTSRRVYKAAMPHAEAAALIERNSGSHFDPKVVSAFRTVADDFNNTRRRLQPS